MTPLGWLGRKTSTQTNKQINCFSGFNIQYSDIFCWKNVSSFCSYSYFFSKSYSHFFSKKFQHICVSLNVNFNKSLTNNVVTLNNWALVSPLIWSYGANSKIGCSNVRKCMVKSKFFPLFNVNVVCIKLRNMLYTLVKTFLLSFEEWNCNKNDSFHRKLIRCMHYSQQYRQYLPLC